MEPLTARRSSLRARVRWVLDELSEGNQSAFARRVGITQQAVSKIAAGGGVSGEVLERIARAFPTVNPEWLLTGRGQRLRIR